MAIAIKQKTCKCGCGKEGYIFGHGLIQACYRREYAKKHNKTQSRKNLFTKKPVLNNAARKNLDSMIKKAKRLKKVSNKNTHSDSDGNRYTSEEINKKRDKAKQEFYDWFMDEYGYIYCEECKKEFDEQDIEPEAGCERKDISHTISEKKAKEDGMVELCWDWKNNFRYLGRRHHQIHDKLY